MRLLISVAGMNGPTLEEDLSQRFINLQTVEKLGGKFPTVCRNPIWGEWALPLPHRIPVGFTLSLRQGMIKEEYI